MGKLISSNYERNEELNRLLREATKRPMTAEDRFEQKVSFVYGQMMDCAPNITKEEVREHLRKMDP